MPSAEKAQLQASLNRQTSAAEADLPPAYEQPPGVSPQPGTTGSSSTAPTVPIPSQNPLDALSRLAAIDFPKYCVPHSKLSDDFTTVTTSKSELHSTPYALAKFLREQASLPPKPIMIVRGTHAGHVPGRAGDTVDFELKLNLTSLLDLDRSAGPGPATSIATTTTTTTPNRMQAKVFQGTGADSSAPSPWIDVGTRWSGMRDGNPLDTWVRTFCEDRTENRSFTLRRISPSLPTPILEGAVRTLVAATRYRGKVTVEFVMNYSAVTVVRQSGNWFTNMLRLYPTRNYEVVEAVWEVGETRTASGGGDGDDDDHRPLNSLTPDPDAATVEGSTTDCHGRAGMIAQAWWREWQSAIQNAVLARKRGWVTVEDWIEARMGVRGQERTRDWGVDYES